MGRVGWWLSPQEEADWLVSRVKLFLIAASEFIVKIFMIILGILGLLHVSVWISIGLFISSFVGDKITKKKQYSLYFGSIERARNLGAWRSHVNRAKTVDKAKEYLIIFLCSCIGLYFAELLGVFSIVQIGNGDTRTYLIICVLAIMSSIEIQSIYENLKGPILEKEKKSWMDPTIPPIFENERSELELEKLKLIETISNLGVDRAIEILNKVKGSQPLNSEKRGQETEEQDSESHLEEDERGEG